MKINATILSAVGVLWVGTIIVSWNAGKKQASSAFAAGAKSGSTTPSSQGYGPGERNDRHYSRSRREAEKLLTAKQIIAKVTLSMRDPAAMSNPMSSIKSLALLDQIRLEDIPAATVFEQTTAIAPIEPVTYRDTPGVHKDRWYPGHFV